MSAKTKLIVQHSAAGIVFGVVLALIGLWSGYAGFNEPPVYAVIILTTIMSVSSAVPRAIAAGKAHGKL